MHIQYHCLAYIYTINIINMHCYVLCMTIIMNVYDKIIFIHKIYDMHTIHPCFFPRREHLLTSYSSFNNIEFEFL